MAHDKFMKRSLPIPFYYTSGIRFFFGAQYFPLKLRRKAVTGKPRVEPPPQGITDKLA